MDVNELKQKKQELEARLSELILAEALKFTDETGVSIGDIGIKFIPLKLKTKDGSAKYVTDDDCVKVYLDL